MSDHRRVGRGRNVQQSLQKTDESQQRTWRFRYRLGNWERDRILVDWQVGDANLDALRSRAVVLRILGESIRVFLLPSSSVVAGRDVHIHNPKHFERLFALPAQDDSEHAT